MALQTHTLVFQCGLFELTTYLAIVSKVQAWEADTDAPDLSVVSTDFNLVAKRVTVVATVETEFV